MKHLYQMTHPWLSKEVREQGDCNSYVDATYLNHSTESTDCLIVWLMFFCGTKAGSIQLRLVLGVTEGARRRLSRLGVCEFKILHATFHYFYGFMDIVIAISSIGRSTRSVMHLFNSRAQVDIWKLNTLLLM